MGFFIPNALWASFILLHHEKIITFTYRMCEYFVLFFAKNQPNDG